MDGKYVGNRPIKLSKIKEDGVYGKIDTVSVSGRKVCLSVLLLPLPSFFFLPPSPFSLHSLSP